MEIMEMAKKKKEKDEEKSEPVLAEDAPANTSSELNAPLWSVISFEKREAHSLSYDEAALRMAELETAGISGLCLVTDEAAAKMSEP